MFLSHGYHGTGLSEVLASVHVPKGSFYNYFESKDAFVAAVEVLIRVGGGPQSHREVAMARALGVEVTEYELGSSDAAGPEFA